MTMYLRNFAFLLVVATAVLVTGCTDQTPFEPEEASSLDIEATQEVQHNNWTEVGEVAGRTIRNIELPLGGEHEGQTFTGRIVNLQLEEVDGDLLASGRVIGQINGERINETFEDLPLDVFDEEGNLIGNGDNGNGECEILFLELGPIFLDLLGLQVDVPNPIVVEITAVEGPGNLLGNLLCELVGLLD